MSRGARFGGRSSLGGGWSGYRFRNDRLRAAAGTHSSTTGSDQYENDKDYRCKILRNRLQRKMADAESVDGDCLGCDDLKEEMSDCPGVEKLKFEREGSLSGAELKKLPRKERWCRTYIQLLKRAARDAEGKDCSECDTYIKTMDKWGCADLKLGAKKEANS